MWILPKNYQLYSAFAQDMVASKEDLTLQDLNIESSLMWKSKPLLLQTYYRKWKEGNWNQRLFTRILKPSQHTCFETKLALSLEDIPVNHSVPMVIAREKMTQDTYGLSLESICKLSDQDNASLRMSKGISRLDYPASLATWKRMVMEQRGEYSQRVKYSQSIKENEYSSWPTPTAHMGGEGGYPTEWTRNTPTLTAEAMKREGLLHSSGYLNPEWVEWLMGVPTGWTDLGCWGME